MDVSVTESEEAFSLPEWADLVDKDRRAHIFALPDWHRIWWEEFGAGKSLQVLTFLDPDPIAIAPVMYDDTPEGRRVRFLGGDDLTDYLGPVVPDEDDLPKVAEAFVDFMATQAPPWDVIDAKGMPVPLGFTEWLVEAADRRNLEFAIEETEVAAVLPLPRSVEEYFHRLPGKRRHELRRKLRRFDDVCPDARMVRTTDDTLTQDVLKFVDMHKGSGGLKGKFFLPERATFFARVAQAFQPKGLLSLDFILAGGRPVASTFSYQYRGTFYLYNSAYDPDFRAGAPGLVLVEKLIERCIQQGYEVFDFLRGGERYKFDLGAQKLPLNSVTLRRA